MLHPCAENSKCSSRFVAVNRQACSRQVAMFARKRLNSGANGLDAC
jgi:hypothetical protein